MADIAGLLKHNYKAGPAFFAVHTVSQLKQWPLEALDTLGNIPFPMRYDAGIDRYNAVEWASVLAEVGSSLASAEKVILSGAPAFAEELHALELILADVLRCPVVILEGNCFCEPYDSDGSRVVIVLGDSTDAIRELGDGNNDLLVCLCENVPSAMFQVSARALVLPITPNCWRLSHVIFHRLLRTDYDALSRHQLQDFNGWSNDLSQPLSSVLTHMMKYILVRDIGAFDD